MFSLPKIYPITDTKLSGISHVEQVQRLVAGGAEFIQLREKSLSAGAFYEQAVECVAIAHENGSRIIINDRADIALAAKADGVHLGQDDLSPREARVLLGEKAIIGFSTHSIEQARRAAELPIDYVAIGPIFATATKENPEPIVGLDGLSAVRSITKLPVVAIGGISETNILSVFDTGADSAAIIGSIMSDPENISANMARFTRLVA